MEEPISVEQPVEPLDQNGNPVKGSSSTFAALRHRNFQLYFGGQLVSNAGTWMQVIAQAWLVYQLSHSDLTLGIVAFASALPTLLVSPWGGVIVDRVPKRELLIITQSSAMILAFILGALTFLNVVQEWHVFILAAALGLVNAFDAPARQAFVVEMVGRDDLPNAIALNSLMFNSARVIGPALGGLLLAAVGTAWCFMINGLSFLAVILGLWLMKLPARVSIIHSGSPWKQLVSGVHYTAGHKDLSALLWLALIFSVFGISYSTLLPAFVEQILNQGAVAYGVINAASGLGAVTGAFMIASGWTHGKRGRWLQFSTIGFPLVLAIFAFVTFYPLSLVLAYGLGVGFMVQFTMINTLLQTRVEDDFRGRVMALYTITFFGFTPFGNLLIGALGQWLTLGLALVLFAVLSLILSVLVFIKAYRIQELP